MIKRFTSVECAKIRHVNRHDQTDFLLCFP